MKIGETKKHNYMSKELIEGLLAVNCAYNYKEEARDNTTTQCRCYSKECMMNQDKEIAKDIQEKGCVIYTKEFVQEVIRRKGK